MLVRIKCCAVLAVFVIHFLFLFICYLFIYWKWEREKRKEKKKKKESLFLPPLGSSWDLNGVGMGKETLVRDECVTTVVRPWRKSRKTRKENRENSSRMEAHEVAPDVVDVAPADVIKVSFTQIVQGSKNLNWLSASERQNSAAKLRNRRRRRIKDVLSSTLYCCISLGS